MSDKIDRLSELNPSVRFARSATRHRIPKNSTRHVIENYRLCIEEPPPVGGPSRATRIIYLGEDQHGRALEVMAVEGEGGELLVIHAMELRKKYRKRYVEAGDDEVQDS